MAELYPAGDYGRLFERLKRVVCEPAFFRGEGMVFAHLDRYGQGERIVLPMTKDGATGDGIFGATEYQTVWEIRPNTKPKWKPGFPFRRAAQRMPLL